MQRSFYMAINFFHREVSQSLTQRLAKFLYGATLRIP